MKLSTKDYITILNYYNIPVPYTLYRKKGKNKGKNKGKGKSKGKVKNKKRVVNASKARNLTHKVLALKVCRCIKGVQKTQKVGEKSAIPICVNQIFKKHGIKPYRFRCTRKRNHATKDTHAYQLIGDLSKTRKNIQY